MPFYDEGHDLVCYLSDFFCQSDSVCYELGVSTGQLIKKVLAITQSVEHELAQILIDNAPKDLKEKAIELMEGPSVPKAALEQDDVDNLLDSLGF